MPVKVYDGTNWVTVAGDGAQGPSGAAPLTTKGDLLGFDTAANRVAVGTNGQTLVADSTATAGVRWQDTFAAGKNKVLNGDFGIWQRGTSIAVSSSTSPFVSDRWRLATNASQDSTVSRQLVSDTTNLPEIQYCLRYQRNSGQTGVNPVYLMQYNETISCVPLAGKTVTLSFYARKGANFSSTSNVLSMGFITGTGTDQNLWNVGYTNQATTGSLNATLTATMQRFSATFTLPTNTTEFGYWFYYSPTGTAGAADYFEITGVQLEAGSVATAFQTATGTIQGELAACQRYYFRQGGLQTYQQMGFGFASSTSAVYINVPLPVEMRAIPTSVEFSTLRLSDTQTTGAVSALTLISNQSSTTRPTVNATYTASGATQYRPYLMETNNSTSGYLAFSAEL